MPGTHEGANDQLGGDRNLTILVGMDQLPTQKDQQRRNKMSDQENRNQGAVGVWDRESGDRIKGCDGACLHAIGPLARANG
jgi:hypothetical protein